MEENTNDLYAIFPQEASETESINEEPLEQEVEDKKKESNTNNEDLVTNPTKNPQFEETPKDDTERLLFEERERQLNSNEIGIEKNVEAEDILSQYELTKIKTDELTYIGYIKNFDSKEYFGICNYSNGDCYIGQWLNNMKHGYGKYIFKNGNLCLGEFQNDKQDGYAEYIKGSNSWKGQMKDFKLTGGTVILLKDNDVFFEGDIEFTGKKCIGFGKYYEGDSYYLGEAKDNITKQGYGIKFRKNKYLFKGLMEKNLRNGYGENYFPDGSRFFGFYKNNLKHGFGIEFFKDGRASLAKYEDDNKNGYVIVIQKNVAKIEIWHFGFKTKVVEKFETANIKQFLKISYPEYWWALNINYKKLFDTFMNVIDEDAQKEKEKLEKEKLEKEKLEKELLDKELEKEKQKEKLNKEKKKLEKEKLEKEKHEKEMLEKEKLEKEKLEKEKLEKENLEKEKLEKDKLDATNTELKPDNNEIKLDAPNTELKPDNTTNNTTITEIKPDTKDTNTEIKTEVVDNNVPIEPKNDILTEVADVNKK